MTVTYCMSHCKILYLFHNTCPELTCRLLASTVLILSMFVCVPLLWLAVGYSPQHAPHYLFLVLEHVPAMNEMRSIISSCCNEYETRQPRQICFGTFTQECQRQAKHSPVVSSTSDRYVDDSDTWQGQWGSMPLCTTSGKRLNT